VEGRHANREPLIREPASVRDREAQAMLKFDGNPRPVVLYS
jgi:hypothetical protein